MAEKGRAAILYETSLASADEKFSEVFQNVPGATGTMVKFLALGSGGTVKLYQRMIASGKFILVESSSITAGTDNAVIINLNYADDIKCSFTPTTFDDVTLIEINAQSRGGR
tara:strand:- start:3578 stop:3913 length:336 start_codon:yes stop_codon:yes gene_type:complete